MFPLLRKGANEGGRWSNLRTEMFKQLGRELSVRRKFTEELRREVDNWERQLVAAARGEFASAEEGVDADEDEDEDDDDEPVRARAVTVRGGAANAARFDGVYTLAGTYTEARESAGAKASGKGEGKAGSREQALNQALAALEEDEGKKFGKGDRPPGVGAVSERLERAGQAPTSRAELNRHYEKYVAAGAEKRSGKALSEREKALFKVFDAIQDDPAKWSSDGRPQLDAVNQRLESDGDEAVSPEELGRAFTKYSGE